MGIFGDIVKGVGNAVSKPIRGVGRIVRGNIKEGLGDIAGGVVDATKFTPLRLSGAAPVLNAAGRLGSGEDIGDALKGGLSLAGQNAAGAAVLGAGSLAAPALAGAGGAGGGGIVSTALGLGQKGLDWLLKNPELLLAGASMVQGAKRQGDADQTMRSLTDLVMQDYQSRLPIREEMLRSLKDPAVTREALEGAFSGGPNPYR